MNGDPRLQVMADMLHSASEAERWASDHLGHLMRQARSNGMTISQIAEAAHAAESDVWLITDGAL